MSLRDRINIRRDNGETLLELMFAIIILAVCVVAIGSGIVLSVKISSIHRSQATADDFLHNYAEAIQSSYETCSGGATPDYRTLSNSDTLPVPSGYTMAKPAVKFWDTSTSSFTGTGTSCPATDPGLQQVTFTLKDDSGFVTESLVAIVRSTT
jgi:type II secretory pathway pseudopilin PulG